VSFFRRLLQFAGKKKSNGESPSIVMLLREPHFFSAPELEKAGAKGWDKCFDGKEDPMYFITQSGSITFLKAGKYGIHLIHADEPYLQSTPEVMK
jgi:hypothetical protein